MKRRGFLKYGGLLAAGTAAGMSSIKNASEISGSKKLNKKAKNIILLVSDGMSIGTFNIADIFLQRKEGRNSHWLNLYKENKVTRALMDTASASSLITDSAAASSSWGGGVRVNNGALNIGPNGEMYKPIWQKMKAAGKSVGCVTTVPITHATPAGFCINSASRSGQDEIAENYLQLKFDVMMGGGLEHFDKELRADKKDLLQSFQFNGFEVVKSRLDMLNIQSKKPLLGVFYKDGFPYSVDRENNSELKASIPTLAEMTTVAINQMKDNQNGFALQVEAGKVDWAAHGNDIAAIIHEQIAFDEAVKVAMDFAENNKETLVIITTDHGNANPGLIYGENANKMFDTLQNYKHSNDWVLNGIRKTDTAKQVIDRVEEACKYVISESEAMDLLKAYESLGEVGVYNPRKLPFRKLAELQGKQNAIGWISMDHSADFVELAMYGPGKELLPAFIKNTDLHLIMLNAAQIALN
jgi:alkaline phosphatase